MKNLGQINDPKDIVTKEYVDEQNEDLTIQLHNKVNISDIYEEKSFGWTEFDYTWTSESDSEPYYTNTQIGGISNYVIHCAGQTLAFEFNNKNINEYNYDYNYIIINGIKYQGTSGNISSTYMETDIIVNCDMTTYTFSNMIKQSLKGLPEEITIDSELSDTSINPVENKVITEKINELNDELDNKTKVGLPASKKIIPFGWTEFETSWIDSMTQEEVNPEDNYSSINDTGISIGGWTGDIIIHCAGQMIGFTYSIHGWSDTTIIINGEETSYVYTDENNITSMDLAVNVIVPLTYMETDIIIRDGGMNGWTFTNMEKQLIEIFPVNTAVRNLNNNFNNLEEKVNNTYTKTETDIAIANAPHLKRTIVTELPTVGDTNTIYMVSSTTTSENNIYLEYMYINDSWEQIGSSEVDLTDYVKNTDYATADKAGVVKIRPGYGLNSGNGILSIRGAKETDIDAKNEYMPITPKYLEYAVKSVGDGYYVTNTDYATADKAGVVKINSNSGLRMYSGGTLYCNPATNEEIDAKTQQFKPITPSNLEYAVKSVGDGYYALQSTFDTLIQRIEQLEAQLADVESQLSEI